MVKLTNYKEAFKNADVVVCFVAHDEFKTLKELSIHETKVILDFLGVLKSK